MTKLGLRYVHRVRKGARTYHYFRRPGLPSIALPGAPGSREFMRAYQEALDQKPPPAGARRAAAGSMAALAADWLASPRFRAHKPSTQRTYRRLLNEFLAEHGSKPVAAMASRHVNAAIDALSATPAQANKLLTVLNRMLKFAVKQNWRPDNPARDVERLIYEKKPYPTWSEADIAAFESHWPPGTRARLAFALLLYTGQRRSDVVRMGPQHMQGDEIAVRQGKTGTRLSIPLHDELRAAIAAYQDPSRRVGWGPPDGHLAFLMTEQGQPFSPVGFSNWFKDCAAAAGLEKGLSPHGLRKAAARRLAEAGCTPHQIAAITGHKTLAEVERYTKEVNQRRLARDAVTRLGMPPKREA